ncbi:TolC family protein [Parapedobacter pyrenivorans]|uniref:TolC family protein n=1 Tax=Parapedobacter pyrenivorans TaxID=1305674 RepID=UPI00333E2528
MLKLILPFIYGLLLLDVLHAQPLRDTLEITPAAAETAFIEGNLKLLAGRLEINESQALLIQARVWPNPTITINEVNLWNNHGAEELGRITDNWGNHSQLSVGIEQLIQTAGKRKKAIAMAKTSVDIAEHDFADLLQSLRLELRTRLAALYYSQKRLSLYHQQLEQLRVLLAAYQRQVQQGYVSQSEYLRLQASEMALMKTIDDIREENIEAQQTLQSMLGSAKHQILVVSEPANLPTLEYIKSLSADGLVTRALENRPSLKTATLQAGYAEQQLAYERAQRIPDLTLSIGYDRGGNIMRDFIGLGVSVDIPVFNKNKGNIIAAQTSVERRRLLASHQENEVKAAVLQAWHALMLTAERLERFDTTYETDLDRMAESHHRSFASRHTSLLEYLDSLWAYLEGKDLLLETYESLLAQYETLQFTVGSSLIN